MDTDLSLYVILAFLLGFYYVRSRERQPTKPYVPFDPVWTVTVYPNPEGYIMFNTSYISSAPEALEVTTLVCVVALGIIRDTHSDSAVVDKAAEMLIALHHSTKTVMQTTQGTGH